MVCMIRACSSREQGERHGDDWVALRLVPPVARLGTRIALFRRIVRDRLAPPGMYDYVIARTRSIDDAFAAVAPNIEQVVIFGAGYDSRAIRFADALRGARVFELDAPRPQADKVRGLARRGITVPANVAFVPVDFAATTAAEALATARFAPGASTLYLLEGLTQYLDVPAVDATFGFIGASAGPGSRVVFDYALASVIRGELDTYGEAGMMRSLARSGEPWRFGIEEGCVGEFLAPFGLAVVDEADAAELERRYLGGRHRVNGTQVLVTAVPTTAVPQRPNA